MQDSSHLVDLRYDVAMQLAGRFNRMIDLTMEFLKNMPVKEHCDNCKVIVNCLKSFKHFYSTHRVELENFVIDKMDCDDYSCNQYMKM